MINEQIMSLRCALAKAVLDGCTIWLLAVSSWLIDGGHPKSASSSFELSLHRDKASAMPLDVPLI